MKSSKLPKLQKFEPQNNHLYGMRLPTNNFAGVSVSLLYSLNLLYLFPLQIMFAITQNQLVMPEMYVGFNVCLYFK